MAFTAIVDTRFGETRELYIRLNNFEQLGNHGVPAIARFRGYYSQAAFDAGANFVEEWLVEFPADAPEQPWEMAYTAFGERANTESLPNVSAVVPEWSTSNERLVAQGKVPVLGGPVQAEGVTL